MRQRRLLQNCLIFEQKQNRIGIAQLSFTTFNDNPDFFTQGNDLETKAQSSQWKCPRRAKTQNKKRQIRSLFSSIAMAWCIMDSCHKVIRSIRNTTLKLYADCEKQSVRNAHNCGKTNHGFCTMITHQLTHRYLYVSYWLKIIQQLCLNHRIHRTLP